jgi:O-antigen/teichoic acid export membrane protein
MTLDAASPLPLDDRPAAEAATERKRAVHSQIRGSGLLLLGRVLAKWLNLAVQVLVVRLLSQADFGALAYALSIVALLQNVSTLGLHQTITRFVPMYQEERRYDKLFGTLLLALGVVASIGLVLVAAVYAGRGLLDGLLIEDNRTLALLLVLVFLAPLQAIDNLLLGLFAVFASPGSIFFRRHLLSPGLKLVVLLLVAMGNRSVFVVAGGFLVAELVGVVACTVILGHFLRKERLFAHFDRHRIDVPWREILAFTVPLFSTELLFVALPAMNVVVLERLGNVEEVAAFRVVVPLAMLNQMVITSFFPLFTPAMARMLARRDRDGINKLYWQTEAWIAVLTYPIFVVTFALSLPLTVLLFGARYADSAIVLSLLSLAWYVDAAMGFNSLTLRVFGHFKSILLINVATLVLNLAGLLVLVPYYGATGAALASCVAVIAHNLLNQYGLAVGTGVRMFEPRYTAVYAGIAASALALGLVQWLVSPPIYVGVALAAGASLVVLRSSGRVLQTGEVFPELMRIPGLRYLLGW